MLGNVIPGSDRIPGGLNTAASATKALPNTRSEVSAKLKLSQLSTLQRRHSSLIWPFARMEMGEIMVLLQLSLLDTCMCALSVPYWWSKKTGLLHECPINWQRWQDCLFFQHKRFVQSSAHSCSELEESRWFLVTTGFLKAPGGFGTKALPNTRSEVSEKLKLSQLSTLPRGDSSLIWLFARMETVERMVLLQLSDWLTPASVSFLQYWWPIWDRLLHECPID